MENEGYALEEFIDSFRMGSNFVINTYDKITALFFDQVLFIRKYSSVILSEAKNLTSDPSPSAQGDIV